MAPLAPEVFSPATLATLPAEGGTVGCRRIGAANRPADTKTLDFDSFYRREYVSMVGIARGICGDHQQAEDLAQEAFSRAHKHWDHISSYDRPGAWLRRVTINLALSRRRRLQRELSFLRRAGREPIDTSIGGDPADGPDGEIWAAVAELAPRQRAVITLFYQEDLSTADIADALGCAVSTATSHLNQARTRLAKILGETIDLADQAEQEQRR